MSLALLLLFTALWIKNSRHLSCLEMAFTTQGEQMADQKRTETNRKG